MAKREVEIGDEKGKMMDMMENKGGTQEKES